MLDPGKPLLKPLFIVFVAAVLAFVFAKIGSEVLEGDTLAFDMQILLRAQALRAGYPWLGEVMRDLSAMESTVVLTLLSLASVGYPGLPL